MRHLRLGSVAVFILASTACQQAPVATSDPASNAPSTAAIAQQEANTPDPVGTYLRTTPSKGDLVVSIEPAGGYRLKVGAAGLPNGGATAADCELQAVGALVGDEIVATIVPFESEIGGFSAEDLGDPAGTLTATMTAMGVSLEEDRASSQYCGMGSDLNGDYTRTD